MERVAFAAPNAKSPDHKRIIITPSAIVGMLRIIPAIARPFPAPRLFAFERPIAPNINPRILRIIEKGRNNEASEQINPATAKPLVGFC